MPYGDGTGPAGKGPRTGRGLGYCAGSKTPGYMKSGRGRKAPAGVSRRRRNGVGHDTFRQRGIL